jgi:hypothetical protein
VGILAALLPNQRCLARLEAAVGSLHAVRTLPTWEALQQVCEEAPVDIAVVDLYADGSPNFDALRELRTRYNGIALVAYVTFAP